MKSANRLTIPGLVMVGALVAGAFFIRWVAPEDLASGDSSQLAMGKSIYDSQCARCHGDKLQGEPNWQKRKPDGRLPAPPQDASGPAWHHTDAQLFAIVKEGVAPQIAAVYESDMPAFRAVLTDEQIRLVIAYIKSSWPEEIRGRQKRLTR